MFPVAVGAGGHPRIVSVSSMLVGGSHGGLGVHSSPPVWESHVGTGTPLVLCVLPGLGSCVGLPVFPLLVWGTPCVSLQLGALRAVLPLPKLQFP